MHRKAEIRFYWELRGEFQIFSSVRMRMQLFRLFKDFGTHGRTQGEGPGGPGPPLEIYPALDFQGFFR